jgi:hypothetical protein
MTILYALIWFIVVKLAGKIVSTVYWKINCKDNDFYYVYDVCELEGEIDWFARMIVMVVKWMNSFVWILTILVIIYVWAQLLFSNWDTEKLKKAKMSILYVAIWIAVLVLNYLILTFIIGKVN